MFNFTNMKGFWVLTFVLILPMFVLAQHDTTGTKDWRVYTIVEEMPEYPGGEEALFKYLAYNVNYPQEARNDGLSGVTYIQFIIEKDGSLSEFIVMRESYPTLDAEAMRVMKTLSNFKPGYQRGKPVRVSMIIPIRFDLAGKVKPAKKKRKRKRD